MIDFDKYMIAEEVTFGAENKIFCRYIDDRTLEVEVKKSFVSPLKPAMMGYLRPFGNVRYVELKVDGKDKYDVYRVEDMGKYRRTEEFTAGDIKAKIMAQLSASNNHSLTGSYYGW